MPFHPSSHRQVPVRLALLASVLWAGTAVSAAENPAGPPVSTLDGKPIPPTEEPGCLMAAGIPLPAGKVWTLVTDPKHPGLLYEVRNGSRVAVGVRIEKTYTKQGAEILDPIGSLAAAERAEVVGVGVEVEPTPALMTEIRLLPGLQALRLEAFDITQGGALPTMPSTLRILQLEERSNTAKITKWDGIAVAKQLTALSLKLMDSDAMACLKSLPHPERISSFACIGASPRGEHDWNMLGRLSGVETATLVHLRGLKSEHLAGLSKLRRLDIRGSGVESLDFSAHAPLLESIRADASALARLGDRALPALRHLDILGARVDDKDAAVFAKANPRCAIAHHWMPKLLAACAKADRIRVRTGGTCHRDAAHERTIFEIKDAKEVAALLASMRIEEEHTGFHCMCCGNPTFEIYAGDTLLASLGYHHGRSVRWVDGWPSDAMLDEATQDKLAQLLRAHDYTGPVKELEESRKAEIAQRGLIRAYERLLPADTLAALKGAGSPEACVEILSKLEPRLLLALYGCGPHGWNMSCGLDQMLESVLEKRIEGARIPVLWQGLAEKDAQARAGLARWLYGHDAIRQLAAAERDAILEPTARVGLAQARPASRREVLRVLASMPADRVSGLLLPGVKDWKEPANCPDPEPHGMVSFKPGGLPEECPDRLLHLIVLAKAGVAEAKPLIEAALAKTKDPKETEALREALKALDPRP